MVRQLACKRNNGGQREQSELSSRRDEASRIATWQYSALSSALKRILHPESHTWHAARAVRQSAAHDSVVQWPNITHSSCSVCRRQRESSSCGSNFRKERISGSCHVRSLFLSTIKRQYGFEPKRFGPAERCIELYWSRHDGGKSQFEQLLDYILASSGRGRRQEPGIAFGTDRESCQLETYEV